MPSLSSYPPTFFIRSVYTPYLRANKVIGSDDRQRLRLPLSGLPRLGANTTKTPQLLSICVSVNFFLQLKRKNALTFPMILATKFYCTKIKACRSLRRAYNRQPTIDTRASRSYPNHLHHLVMIRLSIRSSRHMVCHPEFQNQPRCAESQVREKKKYYAFVSA